MIPRRLSAALAVSLMGFALIVSCGADSGTEPPDEAPRTIPVSFGSVTIHAELATTLAEREKGLMNRSAVPDSSGMLFVFGVDQQLSFWMKDTPINLAIAFLDSAKRILNIEEMTALDDRTLHRSNGLARYALEVRQGWFTAHGIVAGTTATFTLPPGLVISP